MTKTVTPGVSELVCIRCGVKKPASSFQGRGNTVRNGVKYKRRSDLCRVCEREHRIGLGLCPNCSRNERPASGFSKCQKCLDTQRISLAACKARDREAVFAYYGRCCRYCGQSRTVFLTVDHIDGGGIRLRKSSTYDNGWGWLRRHRFPDGVQILCYNCNNAKSFLGELRLLELLRENNRLTMSGLERLVYRSGVCESSSARGKV